MIRTSLLPACCCESPRIKYTHIHSLVIAAVPCPSQIGRFHLGSPLLHTPRPPDPLDALRQAHVIRLELVVAPSSEQHDAKVGPFEGLAGLGYAPFGEVVGYGTPKQAPRYQYTIRSLDSCSVANHKCGWGGSDVLEADVAVDEDQADECAVENWAERARCEGRDGDGDDGCGDNPEAGVLALAFHRTFPCLRIMRSFSSM